MNYLTLANSLTWDDVPARAIALYEKNASAATTISKAIEPLSREGFMSLWRDADEDRLWLTMGDWTSAEDMDAWKSVLTPLCARLTVEAEVTPPKEKGMLKIAFRYPQRSLSAIKQAQSDALVAAGQAGGYLPGGWTKDFGGPTPLTGMLGSGLIGAGLGYGAGWLGEKVLPKSWRKGRLRRTLAMMGAAAGAAPGAAMVADNLHKGRDWNSGVLTDPLRYHPDADIKEAESRTGFDTSEWDRDPPIPIDTFTRQMRDPRVSSRLAPQTQAATYGLLESAYHASPQGKTKGPRIIWPTDIARVAAGMGSGYASGALVGTALGALIGMPVSAQNRLKSTGMWAGVVANMVPLAFGR